MTWTLIACAAAAPRVGKVLVFDKLIKKAAEPIPSSARSS